MFDAFPDILQPFTTTLIGGPKSMPNIGALSLSSLLLLAAAGTGVGPNGPSGAPMWLTCSLSDSHSAMPTASSVLQRKLVVRVLRRS